MDRPLIYPGAIPLETDLLSSSKDAYMGIAKLAAALFGTGNFVNGLACNPNTTAALNIVVSPGEIYSLQNVDATAYSSIVADTTHQILKQGILMDAATLNCAAPGTVGYSINYLVQAAFLEADGGSTVLPYYNASNPAVAWSGPNNTGTAQNTVRSDSCVVTVKAGTAATTGTQITPAPDAGNVGLWVVTVAQGQTTITAGNISQYSGAALVPAGGAISNAFNAILNKSVAGNTNITLDPNGEAVYPIINMLGVVTGDASVIVPSTPRQWIAINNTSGAFARTVKTAAGTGISVPQGTAMVLYCDGTNVKDATTSAARFSKEFESAELVFALNAAVSTAHGLGVVPKLFKAVLRCKTAEGGYAIGDEVDVTSYSGVWQTGYPVSSCTVDSTNIAWASFSTFSMCRKDATNGFSLTVANWKLVLRAWK